MEKVSLQSEDSAPVLQSSAILPESENHEGFMDRFTPKFVRKAKSVFRKDGIRGVIKVYGWKFFAVFFLYYLIRDSFLYILLPYLIAKGLFS